MTSHKIMVVDDNAATRRMVRNALERHGHDVIEAADGHTARELMESARPRLVLQDLMLPDVDGFRLVAELRGIAGDREVAILAFSGFVTDLNEARVSTVGFDDLIIKPIAPSRLVPMIEAHLPRAVPTEERFGAGRRVVVADDDPMQLKLVTFRLTRLGFDVEGVLDAKAALEAARRTRPELIVSDVMMPGLDGFGLAMAVRQDPTLHALPVLLVTSSYVEPEDQELARRAGANDLLPRTPELVELLEAMRITLTTKAVPAIDPEVFEALDKEHNRRVVRQLERQVLLDGRLAKRCSALASELTLLGGISDAVLTHRDVEVALDEAIAECFDAGGISVGALYLSEGEHLRVRPVGAGMTADLTANLATFFGNEHLLRDAIQAGRTLSLPSKEAATAVEISVLESSGANALLMVPLVHVGAPLGGLLMLSSSNDLEHEDWGVFARGVAAQISHVLTLARAFSARELAEQKAVSHAAFLDAMLVNAPDFVVHLDLDGTIRFMNRTVTGERTEDLVGTNLFAYPAGDHQRELRAAMDRLIASGEPQGFDAPVIRPDGTQIWYSTRLGPVTQAGALSGVVVVSRDVSENKRTELHLMVADRMASIGTLAAGVAHEINNPLASVIANLDMALQDVTVTDPAHLPADLLDELHDARTAADRVREIVRDLKIFSRAEDDTQGPVDVVHVLESTLRMAWNELRHRARLVANYGKVPLVEANESRLGQVFLNLILNAAQAMPAGNYDENRLTITTEVDARGVVVTITDTGSGIPPELQPRMFTPFFTTKPVGVGTGLGLAISHRIISELGGTITFESEAGKGSSFYVTLPTIVEVEPPSAERGAAKTHGKRRGMVLVVDDEEPLIHAIRRFLSTEHEVSAVNSARVALQLLRDGSRYDVILCDLMMPQITGMDLYAEIVLMDPAQAERMVFLSGGAFTQSAREFLDRTKNPRLEKPFAIEDLRRLVNELVN